MRQVTEATQSILTDDNAQRMIDWIAPVYGYSYVGLWMLQAIGVAVTIATDITEDLRTETIVSTADSLLSMWEAHYGLPDGTGMTAAERRARIMLQTAAYGPCNPAKLATAASNAIGGELAYIIEHTGPYTFAVRIERTADESALAAVRKALTPIKPAELRMEIDPDFNQHGQLHVQTHEFLSAYTHQQVREDPEVLLVSVNGNTALSSRTNDYLEDFTNTQIRTDPSVVETEG